MGLFDRLEAGLERAVQGTFAKHLRSAVHPVEIASHIRRAMDDRAVTGSGRAIVPNVFTIELSPGDYDRLHPDLHNVEMDLVAAVERFTAANGEADWPAHPIFGPLTRRAWMRWGYLHVDHHLRQFSA